MNAEYRRVGVLLGVLLLVFLAALPFLQFDYTLQVVALGGALLGVVSGALGCFAVLRRQSLIGDALAHAALPGVALAFLLMGRQITWLLLGAGVAGWLGVLFIRWISRTTRIKEDAAMGIVLSAFFALGIALLVYIQSRPDASQAGLDRFIFGQAAAMSARDLWMIAGVGALVFGALALFWKELKLLTFDAEFAGANGFPVRALDVLLSTLIVVAIVLGLQLAGVILMVGLLIAPAIAARQWTLHLEPMTLLAAGFGAFAGAGGAVLSSTGANLPTGPLIIVVASALVFVSILFAPERGLLWVWWHGRQVREQFAAQLVLQDIYRNAQRHQDPQKAMPQGMLLTLRGRVALVGLRSLAADGMAAQENDCWRLTAAGWARAEHPDS